MSLTRTPIDSLATLAARVIVLALVGAGAPSAAQGQIDDRLAAAWSSHDVFALDQALSAEPRHSSKTDAFYRGAVAIMLGRSVEGRAELLAFMSDPRADRGLTIQALQLMADDALRREDYADCADRLSRVIARYADVPHRKRTHRNRRHARRRRGA